VKIHANFGTLSHLHNEISNCETDDEMKKALKSQKASYMNELFIYLNFSMILNLIHKSEHFFFFRRRN